MTGKLRAMMVEEYFRFYTALFPLWSGSTAARPCHIKRGEREENRCCKMLRMYSASEKWLIIYLLIYSAVLYLLIFAHWELPSTTYNHRQDSLVCLGLTSLRWGKHFHSSNNLQTFTHRPILSPRNYMYINMSWSSVYKKWQTPFEWRKGTTQKRKAYKEQDLQLEQN